MSFEPPQRLPMKAPYPSKNAGLGGVPDRSIDLPVTCVFLILFICSAATHMTILQVNQKRGKKFIISGMLFGFSMARIISCVMRLVWMGYPKNGRIAIAAQILVAAGVVLLFIVNLIFVQRIIRATYPQWAWKKWFSIMFKVYYASIVVVLILLITFTVQSFYTLNTKTLRMDSDVRLFGQVYFAVAAFLPLPILVLKLILPMRGRVEKFGEGRFRTKIMIVAFASGILTFAAAFKAGTGFVPRPKENPAWYQSKACFYIFNFTIEIIVLAFYAIIRIDKRFIIPNGSHAPGHYVHGVEKPDEERPGFGDMVLHDEEEQVFYDEEPKSPGTTKPNLVNPNSGRSSVTAPNSTQKQTVSQAPTPSHPAPSTTPKNEAFQQPPQTP